MPARFRVDAAGQKLNRSLEKAVVGLAHGMRYMMDPRPPEADCTPRTVVLERGKLKVERFEGGRRAFATPLLLVPPLMVKAYVFDLRAGHSFAADLVAHGFDVFRVDFGTPERGDEHVRLDDYVQSYVGEAVAAVGAASGSPRVSLLGYCLGGLFSLLYTAAEGRGQVRNLCLIACPVDYGKMGLISYVTQHAHGQIKAIIDRLGNVPGFVPSLALNLASPVSVLTRYADLFLNLWNEEYLKGYQSLNAWLNDFVPGPHDAYLEFIDRFVVDNQLVHGETCVGGRPVHVRDVRCPVLSLAGTRDHVATPASAREILGLVGSEDKAFQEVSGGHVGIMAGSHAPETTWRRVREWLAERSGAGEDREVG